MSWLVKGSGNGFLMRGLKDQRLLDAEWLRLEVPGACEPLSAHRLRTGLFALRVLHPGEVS